MADFISPILNYGAKKRATKRIKKANRKIEERMNEEFKKSEEFYNRAMEENTNNIKFFNRMLHNTDDKYGSIENNITRFYENLSSGDFAVQAKQKHQIAFQKAVERFKANNAMRGLSGSEFEAKQLSMMTLQNYENQAQVELNAKLQSIEAQNRYYNQTGRIEKNFWTNNLVNSRNRDVSLNYNRGATMLNQANIDQSRLSQGQAMRNNSAISEARSVGDIVGSVVNTGVEIATGLPTSFTGQQINPVMSPINIAKSYGYNPNAQSQPSYNVPGSMYDQWSFQKGW